jgi:DNA-binding transcriptional MerR regulator
VAEQVIRAIPTPAVCRLTGVAPATLDYWVRANLVAPSVRGSNGRRVTRLWSVGDAVCVRAIKALRDAGCPLQVVRKVKDVLSQLGEDAFKDQILYWDGSDVLGVDRWGELQSLRRRPRQLMLHVVAIPIADWAQEAAAELRPTRSTLGVTSRSVRQATQRIAN